MPFYNKILQWLMMAMTNMMEYLQALLSLHIHGLTHPPGQNGRRFADDIFRCIFVNENFIVWFKFHWSMFLRDQLTIIKHEFRWWLGALGGNDLKLGCEWVLCPIFVLLPPVCARGLYFKSMYPTCSMNPHLSLHVLLQVTCAVIFVSAFVSC